MRGIGFMRPCSGQTYQEISKGAEIKMSVQSLTIGSDYDKLETSEKIIQVKISKQNTFLVFGNGDLICKSFSVFVDLPPPPKKG